MARQPTKKVIQELQSILEYTKFFQKVSTEPKKDLTQEDVFPSVYLHINGTVNKLNGLNTITGCEYNRQMIVELHVNLDLENSLDFLDVYDLVETAVLEDSKLWEFVIDRNVNGSTFDDGKEYPKKSGVIFVSLFYRSTI